MRRFRDRAEAGRALGRALARYAGRSDVIVLALPRGGVPVAAEVAHALNAPMDVYLVRKLGAPGHAELAMGAIATGGVLVRNEDVVELLGVTDSMMEAEAAREGVELERRERAYRGARPAPELRGRICILVDDGLATGASMRAAAAAVRASGPEQVIVAVPVAAEQTCAALRADDDVDEVECLTTPEPFQAVGLWYDDFEQVGDAEVVSLLQGAVT